MDLAIGPRPLRNERGAALVVAALSLLLVSAVAATIMTTMTGERAVASNVHVAKGALYAADAGVRTSQQTLANYAQTKLAEVTSEWSGNGPMITNPNAFFPAGVTTLTSTNPDFTSSYTVAWADSDLTDSSQVFRYRYSITSNGQQGAQGTRQVQSDGMIIVSASRGSFADYLIYTNTHLMPNGSKIWFTSSGFFDGRIHTNTQFRIAYRPTFEELITSVNQEAWYYNLGDHVELDADNNGSIDVPNCNGGFDRGVSNLALPPNSYGQQNAALGLNPASTSAPSNSTILTQLGLGGSGAPPDGIYLVNSGGSMTGGIYVQGSLNQCVMSVDLLGRQVYQMTQGSTQRTITVDRANNTTTVSDGLLTSTTYNGLPRGILYTNGSILDLGGPDRLPPLLPPLPPAPIPPAIANGTEMLVTATGNIVIQNDVVYQDYHNGNSVLGLYSGDGSVIVGQDAPNDMWLDAYVMAAGSSGAFEVDDYNYGSPRGTFHLRGGMVTEYYGAFYTFDDDGELKTGYARDFNYDRRGLKPPYYPTTSRFVPNSPSARTLVWKET